MNSNKRSTPIRNVKLQTIFVTFWREPKPSTVPTLISVHNKVVQIHWKTSNFLDNSLKCFSNGCASRSRGPPPKNSYPETATTHQNNGRHVVVAAAAPSEDTRQHLAQRLHQHNIQARCHSRVEIPRIRICRHSIQEFATTSTSPQPPQPPPSASSSSSLFAVSAAPVPATHSTTTRSTEELLSLFGGGADALSQTRSQSPIQQPQATENLMSQTITTPHNNKDAPQDNTLLLLQDDALELPISNDQDDSSTSSSSSDEE